MYVYPCMDVRTLHICNQRQMRLAFTTSKSTIETVLYLYARTSECGKLFCILWISSLVHKWPNCSVHARKDENHPEGILAKTSKGDCGSLSLIETVRLSTESTNSTQIDQLPKCSGRVLYYILPSIFRFQNKACESDHNHHTFNIQHLHAKAQW